MPEPSEAPNIAIRPGCGKVGSGLRLQSKESGIVSTAQPSMLAAQKKGASEETPIHTK
jgi:hypothetical protein